MSSNCNIATESRKELASIRRDLGDDACEKPVKKKTATPSSDSAASSADESEKGSDQSEGSSSSSSSSSGRESSKPPEPRPKKEKAKEDKKDKTNKENSKRNPKSSKEETSQGQVGLPAAFQKAAMSAAMSSKGFETGIDKREKSGDVASEKKGKKHKKSDDGLESEDPPKKKTKKERPRSPSPKAAKESSDSEAIVDDRSKVSKATKEEKSKSKKDGKNKHREPKVAPESVDGASSPEAGDEKSRNSKRKDKKHQRHAASEKGDAQITPSKQYPKLAQQSPCASARASSQMSVQPFKAPEWMTPLGLKTNKDITIAANIFAEEGIDSMVGVGDHSMSLQDACAYTLARRVHNSIDQQCCILCDGLASHVAQNQSASNFSKVYSHRWCCSTSTSVYLSVLGLHASSKLIVLAVVVGSAQSLGLRCVGGAGRLQEALPDRVAVDRV